MGNAFDFELHADDNATKVLAEIEARIKQLNPLLGSTRDALRFGGSETLDTTGSLSNQLRDMSRYAQDNVQNIGDMIPPLKNFGELFSKYSGLTSKMGLFGGIGGVIGGVTAGYSTLREMGREANNIDTLSKNTAMSIEDTTKLTGALVQVGADADDAKQSVQNLFNVLNAAKRGENVSARSELDNLQIPIHTTKDGSADTIPTLLEIAKKFPNMPSETQFRLSNKLGLTPDILTLIRENKIDERLDKSVKNGQSRTTAENQILTDFNTEANEISARIDGLWHRTKITGATWFLGNSKEAKESAEIKSVQEYKKRENDTANNFYHGNKEEDIRQRALRDKEFQKQLTFTENLSLTINKPDEGLQKKLNDKYSELWEKQKKAHEVKLAVNKIPPLPKVEAPNYPNPLKNGRTPRGIRNNNPGNLTDAPNAVGKDYGNGHVYMKFATPNDGIAALSRQLMLHGDRGQNTLNHVIPIYAPEKAGNNTREYIDYTAKQLGISPNEKMDLHNPAMIEKLIDSIIKMENLGQQPYSKEQIKNAITVSINESRWAGLRNPQTLREQRLQYDTEHNKSESVVEKDENNIFPSTDSIFSDKKNKQDFIDTLTQSLKSALSDNKTQLEVVLVNSETGERQKFQSKTAGKITTSMRYS
ncbi:MULTISPECIES: hypothetical protein [Xenorhabdus]|uniref:hypothetical protein n=1 Tax=Xenorhabdus TaxID=626 RepID=UPI00064A91AD|nr:MULTISPECIES: hypothetical protein [Xenorhabdus]KLU15134.1 hypothetical protein AAY47_12575 [Xenorhabdus griffiniae]KOP34111.1 hypothetical protein AFK69_06295 [Xenorhabdus sp. GDc328]